MTKTSLSKPFFRKGELVKLKYAPTMMGFVTHTMRGPFTHKYRICWSSPASFDEWGTRYGWKYDGWISERCLRKP